MKKEGNGREKMNMMMLNAINYSNESLSPSKIDKVLDILGDKNFGAKTDKDVKNIVEKLRDNGTNRNQGSKHNC
jgi:hypothetical protein